MTEASTIPGRGPGAYGKETGPARREQDAAIGELAVLRRALEAARAEIRTSAADARASKEAAHAAEKALERERKSNTILRNELRRERTRFARRLGLWLKLRLMPSRKTANAAAESKQLNERESAAPAPLPPQKSKAKKAAPSKRSGARNPEKLEGRDRPNLPKEVRSTAAPAEYPAAPLVLDRPVSEIPDLFSLRSMAQGGRLAVVLHHTQAELWPKIREALATIPESFDLFVSFSCGDPQLREAVAGDFPAAQFVPFDGEVSDLLALAALINSGVLFQYDLVCKVESAKLALSRAVLSDATSVARILRAFDTDPDLGIVAAEQDQLLQDAEAWPGIFKRLCDLSARIGMQALATQSESVDFPRDLVGWIRPFLFRPLAALKFTPADFDAVSSDMAAAFHCLTSLVCRDAGMRCVPATSADFIREKAATTKHLKMEVVAFYLPQFHPIPENDIWWEPGFTEWTNVTRARPQFPGHRQPRLPADLGYYDLRLPEVREAQAALARRYGVTAFCYYYYWFDGETLLDRPLREVLSTGSPDFPFLICWANEPWTRGWHGKDREILMPQLYTPGWPRAFAEDIAPILRDPRYFRFLGDPLLLIYRIMSIPDPKGAIEELRAGLKEFGLSRVHIAASSVQFPGDLLMPVDPSSLGLDSVYDFRTKTKPRNMSQEISNGDEFAGNVYLYNDVVNESLHDLDRPTAGVRHRTVVMGWDNTPRRPMTGTALHGATPANFRRWLRRVVQHEARKPGPDERIIFINAWNEWGEGTYLEPDQDFGRGWLEAVASATALP
jgi:lipopolysaccharide biosynthesis protein